MFDYRKLGFSAEEIREIVISTVVLGFVFFYPGRSLFLDILDPALRSGMISSLLLYILIVGLTFIPHELAHKFVSMRYGCVARYEMWKTGLWFALFMAVITNGRFTFAAPGAVMIYLGYDLWGKESRISDKEYAYVSAAGPAMNLLIALSAAATIFTHPAYRVLALSIARVSSFFAFFNLVPVPPLDGSKLFMHNTKLWALMFMAAFIMWGFF